MKKLLLKSMLLLCALIVGSGTMWADTYNSILTFDCAEASAYVGSTSEITSTSDMDAFLEYAASTTNKITVASAPSKVYGAKGNGGTGIPSEVLKVGTASGAGSFSFSIDNSYSKIDRVVITGYGWRNTSKIAVNGSSTQSPTAAATETVFTFDLATATRDISIAVTTSAVCITSIELFEKEVVSGEATTVTINDSGITNTDIASGTAAGSFSAVVKNSSSVAIDGATVTWSSSKTNVATIDSETGAVTLVKKGSTTITASYAGVNGTYQASSNTYELNVANSSAGDGTLAKPFTVLEARDALDASEIDSETDYYVRGIIAKIGTFDDSNGQLTYWISDDGSMTNNVQCYKGKNVDGAAFAAATDLEVGDFATVKGKLTIFSGTTYEFTENNEVVNTTSRTKVNIATFAATTNPLVLDETTTTGTTVTNDQVGWTPVSYTYSSDNESVATVNASGVVTAVAKGTANITVTPNVSATDPTYKVGASKSIEITVSNPSHTASFSINGVVDPANNVDVEEGVSITFPTNPAAIANKAFVGWTTSVIDGTRNDAPAVLVSSATMSTSDITYYAVFAKTTESAGWRKLAASEVKEAGTYALITTDGHAFNGTITKGHGQVTTDAFSFTNNVATTAPTGTYELTIAEVTGGFTMYHEGDGYLYAAAASSGNLDWQNSPTSYWLYESSNWKFYSNGAYLRSYNNSSFRTYANNSGDVLVFAHKTNVVSYSAYCTTVIPEPADPTTSGEETYLTTSDNMAGWRAFYDKDNSYSVDGNTKVYVADADPVGTTITLKKIDGIPANVPVILHTSSSADSHKMTLTKETVSPYSYTDDNKLSWETTAVTDKYRLGFGASGVGFYPYSGTPVSGAVILNVDSSTAGARELTIGFEDETTSLNEELRMKNEKYNAIYNLAGQRVAQPTRGLYIVNGKKVIVK